MDLEWHPHNRSLRFLPGRPFPPSLRLVTSQHEVGPYWVNLHLALPYPRQHRPSTVAAPDAQAAAPPAEPQPSPTAAARPAPGAGSSPPARSGSVSTTAGGDLGGGEPPRPLSAPPLATVAGGSVDVDVDVEVEVDAAAAAPPPPPPYVTVAAAPAALPPAPALLPAADSPGVCVPATAPSLPPPPPLALRVVAEAAAPRLPPPLLPPASALPLSAGGRPPPPGLLQGRQLADAVQKMLQEVYEYGQREAAWQQERRRRRRLQARKRGPGWRVCGGLCSGWNGVRRAARHRQERLLGKETGKEA
jgi:hypothetical protein